MTEPHIQYLLPAYFYQELLAPSPPSLLTHTFPFLFSGGSAGLLFLESFLFHEPRDRIPEELLRNKFMYDALMGNSLVNLV
jgi:hypothetical protein